VHVLKGNKVETDSSLLNRRDVGMIMNNNRLFVKYSKGTGGLQWFVQSYAFDSTNSTPRLVFEKEYGKRADGYYDFYLPYLYKSWNDTAQINIFDYESSQIYTVLNNGEVKKTDSRTMSLKATVPHDMPLSLNTQYAYPMENDRAWIFTGRHSNGRSIYKAVNTPDSLVISEVLSLNVDEKVDFFGAYNGCFAYHPAKQMGVYAYSYYPRVKFVDITTGDTRTVLLQGNEYNPETEGIADGLDLNTMHYWDISITSEYVYALFFGRRWENVTKKQNDAYAYIVQYDWLGNPLKVMKTDHYGLSFCVSSDNRFFFLYSMDEKNIYLYNIPQ
jgi:hypothetical protein